MSDMIKILAGSASQEFGERVASAYGTTLVPVRTQKFSDGEFTVNIEETVRGKEVIIVQSTFPPSDNLLELLMLIDAAKRASAKRIVAVMPYFGFARQDRKDRKDGIDHKDCNDSSDRNDGNDRNDHTDRNIGNGSSDHNDRRGPDDCAN